MARNRKLQSAAVRFGPALKAFLLCLLIGGSGVGYVWQKDQIIRLDRRIKKGEQTLWDLRQKNDNLRKHLTAMRSPQAMQQRIKDLGLIEPQPSQKLRLVEPTKDQQRLLLENPVPQIAGLSRPTR